MSKAIKLFLDIPEPCDQPWDAMQPVPGGRHCLACSKTVVDFTAFSDAELLAYFSDRIGKANPCCHFREDQMHRVIEPPQVPSLWRRQWQKAAALLLSFQVLATGSFAQKSKRAASTQHAGRSRGAKNIVKGQVVALSGGYGPIGFSFYIHLDGDSIKVTTDSNAYFTCMLPKGIKPQIISWEEQQIGSGILLAGSYTMPSNGEPEVLRLLWQVPEHLAQVEVVSHPPAVRIFSGIPPHQVIMSEPIKPSLLKRVKNRLYKKKSR